MELIVLAIAIVILTGCVELLGRFVESLHDLSVKVIQASAGLLSALTKEVFKAIPIAVQLSTKFVLTPIKSFLSQTLNKNSHDKKTRNYNFSSNNSNSENMESNNTGTSRPVFDSMDLDTPAFLRTGNWAINDYGNIVRIPNEFKQMACNEENWKKLLNALPAIFMSSPMEHETKTSSTELNFTEDGQIVSSSVQDNEFANGDFSNPQDTEVNEAYLSDDNFDIEDRDLSDYEAYANSAADIAPEETVSVKADIAPEHVDEVDDLDIRIDTAATIIANQAAIQKAKKRLADTSSF